MSPVSNIQYLRRSQIADSLWNQCVVEAPNTLIYASTWYLDALCDHWDALVYGDYKAVMPLPWRSKWGIKYVYTPFFVPVLNICCTSKAAGIPAVFFEVLTKYFRYGTFDMDQPFITPLPSHWKAAQRTNFILPAEKPPSFSRLVRRKLAAAEHANISIETGVPAEAIIRKYQAVYHATHGVIPKRSFDQLVHACTVAPAGCVQTLAAHLPNAPFAGFYLLLQDNINCYSLLGGSTKAGKNAGAFYALTHKAIQLAQASTKNFRFEGSDRDGIAFFNKQFDPEPQDYSQLRLNRLPWPLSILKE